MNYIIQLNARQLPNSLTAAGPAASALSHQKPIDPTTEEKKPGLQGEDAQQQVLGVLSACLRVLENLLVCCSPFPYIHVCEDVQNANLDQC